MENRVPSAAACAPSPAAPPSPPRRQLLRQGTAPLGSPGSMCETMGPASSSCGSAMAAGVARRPSRLKRSATVSSNMVPSGESRQGTGKDALQATTMDAHRFAEFDTNGDQRIDLEEFIAMQPKRIRECYTSDEIAQWFDAADTDGSGQLSPNEFFMWSLQSAAHTLGLSAIEEAFKKFDRDGTGELDFVEFKQACDEMGFSTVAREIFDDLDEDGGGAISYIEVIANLEGRAPAQDMTRDMLLSMTWTYQSSVREEALAVIDTSKWIIRGEDIETVQSELRRLFKETGRHVSDLMRVFGLDLTDLAASIGLDDFVITMRMKLRFIGPDQVLKSCFASMDYDCSGTIGFCEMFEFIRGRRHALDKRNIIEQTAKLTPPPNLRFDGLLWDVQTLRVLMVQMMARCKLDVAEVFASWVETKRCKKAHHAGGSPISAESRRVRIRGGFSTTTITDTAHAERRGNRGLSRGDFIHAVQTLYFASDDPATADLWVNQVKDVADTAFTEMCDLVHGENFFREVGILHVNRWIGRASNVTDHAAKNYTFPLKSKAQLQQQAERRQLGMILAQRWERQEANYLAAAHSAGGKAGGSPGKDRAQPAPKQKMQYARMQQLAQPRHWRGPPMLPNRTDPALGFQSHRVARHLSRPATAPILRSPSQFLVVNPPVYGMPPSLMPRSHSQRSMTLTPPRPGTAPPRRQRSWTAQQQPLIRYTW